VPLTAGTVSVSEDLQTSANATSVAKQWADQKGWRIADVQARNGLIVVTALGIPPPPAPDALRAA
jgi:hypothetical protein